MKAFDLVVVGSGGGPDETNLSAYLLKPFNNNWYDGILALEAGSGQGALSRLLEKKPLLFGSRGSEEPYSASEIYSFVQSFLISHAHLDHINSLVISAGSLKGARKRIYSTQTALQDLETIFSDRIWPRLASWNEQDEDYKYLYTPNSSSLDRDDDYTNVFPNISARRFPLNHGHDRVSYESSAFLIRQDSSRQQFLFFGDVQPDSTATVPRTINVWREAARLIPDYLSTIFIECSWPSGRQDHLLYGHLTPEHLLDELMALAKEIVKYKRNPSPDDHSRPSRKRHRKNEPTLEDLRGALSGTRIIIIHCKETMDGQPKRDIIVAQVRSLVEDRKLGAEILAAEQGMHIEI